MNRDVLMKQILLLVVLLGGLWVLLPLADAASNDHVASVPARLSWIPSGAPAGNLRPQQAVLSTITATPSTITPPSTVTATPSIMTSTPSTVTPTPSTITPTPSTITPTPSNATPGPSITIAAPTAVAVDFSVDRVAIQSTRKKRGKVLKKARAGANAYVAIYWTLRRAPVGSKPTTLFFGTLCKKKWKTGRLTGSRSSYPPRQYYATLPITLKKAGTYRIGGGVNVDGTMRAAGVAVIVGSRRC